MDERMKRRAKGLCYFCGEKFTSGHVCKNRQFFMIELEKDEEENMEGLMQGDEEMELMEDTPQISVHALDGNDDFHSTKVTGRCNMKVIQILIDNGSTHNFMNNRIATRFGYGITVLKSRPINVANGEKLMCNGKCERVKWKMQGGSFCADFLVLNLESYDVILGIQWLATLGNILWNFKEMWMEFLWERQKFILTGNENNKLKVISEE